MFKLSYFIEMRGENWLSMKFSSCSYSYSGLFLISNFSCATLNMIYSEKIIAVTSQAILQQCLKFLMIFACLIRIRFDELSKIKSWCFKLQIGNIKQMSTDNNMVKFYCKKKHATRKSLQSWQTNYERHFWWKQKLA